MRQVWPLVSAMFLRIADDGHCAGDEQPSQVSIALLGDAAKPILAAGRVLLRHQPDPGGEIASRPERLPVADLGNQGGGDDRAARNLLQPPARLAGAMPGQDALLWTRARHRWRCTVGPTHREYRGPLG